MERRGKKMKKIIYGWVVMVLVLSSILAVCAQAATAPKTATPKYGGTLKTLTSITQRDIGIPWIPSPFQATGMLTKDPCIETLLRLDANGAPIPWLATGWKFSPDMKSLTFTLRQGVKFHDGTDFNAKAVKYNMDKYRASPCPDLKVVSSVDVVDDYTVRLNLSEYQAFFLTNFAFAPGEMVSPTAIETHDEAWSLNHPVGTGPFQFVSYQQNVSLKYKRFDGYWQKGKPYLDAAEWYTIPEPTVCMMAFKQGQGNGLYTTVKNAIELQQEGKYVVNKVTTFSFALAGDSANPDSPFSKLQVRQAVSHAIDSDALVKTFGAGFLRVSNQPIVPESLFYNKAVIGYPHNPQKAKELLAQAGYPNGFKTKIIYQSQSAAAPYFPAIQAYLKEVGINAELQGVPNTLFAQISRDGWKNALIMYATPAYLGFDTGQVLMNFLSSKSAIFKSILHPSDYDTKLLKSLAETDFEKRKAMTQEVVKMAVDDYCLANFIMTEPLVYVTSPSVHDTRMLETWLQLWTPEDAWLSE
jgi:ABC-type transport system substrate-binding protein